MQTSAENRNPAPAARTVTWWSAALADVPESDAWIDDVEARRFASMVYTKRRDEARLARYTAKSTVAAFLGRERDPAALQAITVRNAADGAPEVSVDGQAADVVIAMTDRADWAVAAVIAGSDRIGCDLELVEPRSAAFVRDYFTMREQQMAHEAAEPDLVANLIWSAKESGLKVLRTGLRRDTRTVEVAIEAGETGRWNRLMVTTAEGVELPGWWIRYGDFLLTVAGAVPTHPPASLDDPPRLAAGRPGHSWMANPRRDV